MGMGRMFTVLAVLVLSFVGAIFLESKMEQYAALELAVIVVGILLAVIALIGISSDSRWAWPFATILFSLLLANLLFLHVNVGAFLTFVLLLIVNVFGMLIAILSIEDLVKNLAGRSPEMGAMSPPVETYSTEEQPAKITYKTETKPKAKKAGRKKKR